MPYSPSSEQDAAFEDAATKRLLFFGATILATLAGFVNASMLGFAGIPVSHMSGPATLMAIDLGHGQLHRLVILMAIMLGFMAGAMLSGLMISSTVLRPGRSYGLALLFESILLGLAGGWAGDGHILLTLILAAMACGLQNALASSYRGLTLRTTHVTGIVTDIGVILAHRLRRKKIRLWKLLLLISILASFICGGLLGVFMFMNLGANALFLPSAACLLIAVSYLRIQNRPPPEKTP